MTLERDLLLASVSDYLEQLGEEGLDGLEMRPQPARPAAPESFAVSAENAGSPRPAAGALPVSPVSAPAAGAGFSGALFSPYPGLAKTCTLEELREFIGDCKRCKLAQYRTHLVFGTGNPRARLMFVGEGPGAEEDAQGEPFVGRAGRLLTDIIERGMGLRRADVYICNVIKCRPPENRNPEPDEVAACQPFLDRQIDLVSPEVIVALGTFAAQALFNERTPISRMRGQWREVRGIKAMPTFHPAYLLRSPADKRLVWIDIREVMKVLGLASPRGSGG